MARDSGQIHEASKWFKQALEVDGENPDIVAYIGNLHMRNSEWGPAQKKFEKILEMVRVLSAESTAICSDCCVGPRLSCCYERPGAHCCFKFYSQLDREFSHCATSAIAA